MAQFLPLQSKHSNKLGKIKAFCILFQVISEFWVYTLCTQHQKSVWETTADQIVAFVATLCSFSRFILYLKRNKSQSLHFWNYPGNKFFRNASFADLLSKKHETIRNLDSAEVILSLAREKRKFPEPTHCDRSAMWIHSQEKLFPSFSKILLIVKT